MIVLKKYNIQDKGESIVINGLSKQERESLLNEVEKKANLKNQEFILSIETMNEYLRSQQRKTIYSLLECFIDSSCSSFKDIESMKDYYKERIGEIKGYNYLLAEDVFNFIKSNKDLKFNFVKNQEDIPENKVRFYKIYKSLNDLTKEKGKQLIKLIIQDMVEAGVNTEKFQVIMKGLEKSGENYRNYINSYNQYIN